MAIPYWLKLKRKVWISVCVAVFLSVGCLGWRYVHSDETVASFFNYYYREQGHESPVARRINYVVNLYYQYAAADQFRAHILDKLDHTNSVSFLLDALTEIRYRVLTQRFIMHTPSESADFIAGVGWCDQVNAMAARLVAPYFAKAEVFALRDDSGQSHHSIARVLDKDRNDWLYFDVWGYSVVIFDKTIDGKVNLLASRRVRLNTNEHDLERILKVYDEGIVDGFALAEIEPTFFKQLYNRAVGRLRAPKEFPWTFASEPGEVGICTERHSINPLTEFNSLNDIILDGPLGKKFFLSRLAFLRQANHQETIQNFTELHDEYKSTGLVGTGFGRLVRGNAENAKLATNTLVKE